MITHDLSQIEGAGFVFVLTGGWVMEQSFRADLEAEPPCDSTAEVDLMRVGSFGRWWRHRGKRGAGGSYRRRALSIRPMYLSSE
jgi:hypothetical protein